MTGLLFDIAERHAQGFPVPESALTVMAMTSGAAAASADLDSLYRDLRAAHLHPLWRIERNLLTEHPMPRAIPWVWRAADMYPLGERVIRAVPVNRGGERRVLSLGNPGLGGAPYAAGTLWGPCSALGRARPPQRTGIPRARSGSCSPARGFGRRSTATTVTWALVT